MMRSAPSTQARLDLPRPRAPCPARIVRIVRRCRQRSPFRSLGTHHRAPESRTSDQAQTRLARPGPARTQQTTRRAAITYSARNREHDADRTTAAAAAEQRAAAVQSWSTSSPHRLLQFRGCGNSRALTNDGHAGARRPSLEPPETTRILPSRMHAVPQQGLTAARLGVCVGGRVHRVC